MFEDIVNECLLYVAQQFPIKEHATLYTIVDSKRQHEKGVKTNMMIQM